jgi:hypothetical protein
MPCKTWNLLAEKYFNPLCTNRFFPDATTKSCPICVTPTAGPTVDRCSFFAYMKRTPEDVVRIPRIWTMVFESGAFTLERDYVCNRTAVAGTPTTSFIPELEGVTVTMDSGTDLDSMLWESPQLSIGTRTYSYRHENLSGGVFYEIISYNVTAQFLYSLENIPGHCQRGLTIRLRRTFNPSGSILPGHVGLVDAPASHPCAPAWIVGIMHPFADPEYQDLFPMMVEKTSPASSPLFSEYASVVQRHSPWRYRFGAIFCAEIVTWAHSLVMSTFAEDYHPFFLTPNCRADLYVESWTPSNGLNSPATSPVWTPSAMSFKVSGPL